MGMITVVEKVEKSGIKGWTAKGVWENADIGEAFVELETGFIYIRSVDCDAATVVIEIHEDGTPLVITCPRAFEGIIEGTLAPVNLRIEWERK